MTYNAYLNSEIVFSIKSRTKQPSKIHKKQQSKDTMEEQSQNPEQANPEDKVIDPVLEQKQPIIEETEEEKQGNEGEISVQDPALAPQTDNVGETHTNPSKKTKQNVRTKQVTVPQPFSLATEKRMSRDRRGLADLTPAAEKRTPGEIKDTKAKLLRKSMSLNYKAQVSSQKVGGNSEPTSASARTSSKPTVPRATTRTESVDKNKAEKQTEVRGIKKPEKSTTFKASPLPSFYNRKGAPPKPELKKAAPEMQPKSPSLGQRSKASVSSAGNKDGKASSKEVSSIAKERINKMLTSQKAFTAPEQTVVSSA